MASDCAPGLAWSDELHAAEIDSIGRAAVLGALDTLQCLRRGLGTRYALFYF